MYLLTTSYDKAYRKLGQSAIYDGGMLRNYTY